jgi:hypothetical protein
VPRYRTPALFSRTTDAWLPSNACTGEAGNRTERVHTAHRTHVAWLRARAAALGRARASTCRTSGHCHPRGKSEIWVVSEISFSVTSR